VRITQTGAEVKVTGMGEVLQRLVTLKFMPVTALLTAVGTGMKTGRPPVDSVMKPGRHGSGDQGVATVRVERAEEATIITPFLMAYLRFWANPPNVLSIL
jgi:hypothetical protein